MQEILKIGTRGSPLAMVQAREVKARLLAADGHLEADRVEIVTFKTSGDRIQDRPLMEAGGKGLFTKEIEEALLAGEIDLAVHSAKDMPTALPPGLALTAFPEREDPRDVLISNNGASLDQLSEGAVIGTSSLRRKAQILSNRPDLAVIDFRGNVDTRLGKIRDGVCDATLLALAGLKRLEKDIGNFHVLSTDEMLPAPAQGAICIEIREEDEALARLLALLDHPDTRQCVMAERALLAALDGSCRTPIAALAELESGRLSMRAAIFSPDGQQCYRGEKTGSAGQAAALGTELGEKLRELAGPTFFKELEAYFG